jgi:hypothetical protein
MKFIISGICLYFIFVVACIAFQVPPHLADVLMEPGSLLAQSLPGGLMHNPLNALIALFIQGVLLGIILRMSAFFITRWRKAGSTNDTEGNQ